MIEIKNKKNKFTYNVYHVTKAFFLRRRSCRLLMKSKSRWYGCSYREELAFPCREKSDGDRQKNDS